MKLSKIDSVTPLAIKAIEMMQGLLSRKGFTPVIHFELEGCFSPPEHIKNFVLNFDAINQKLEHLGIAGELVPEYWKNQWEYVSAFNGQSPLEEAFYLDKVIKVLPHLLTQQGVRDTHIRPVVWCGDKGKMVNESQAIFDNDSRDVHIPNAIQINVSVNDSSGNNIIVNNGFGEHLQQSLLETSLSCCLLYLPEEEAFERLALKQRFGLTNELSSPNDISGGHQGSIALYKQWGKHNQNMGEETLLYDNYQQPMVTEHNWMKTARIEHRLGASSLAYNPYVNIVYILMNVITSIEAYESALCEAQLSNIEAMPLPESLYDKEGKHDKKMGAIHLFENSQWFNRTLNRITELAKLEVNQEKNDLGCQLKAAILSHYLFSIAQ